MFAKSYKIATIVFRQIMFVFQREKSEILIDSSVTVAELAKHTGVHNGKHVYKETVQMLLI